MAEQPTLFRKCEVISVDDNTDCNRIKVRYLPEDKGKTLNEIEYCSPAIPQMIHIKPKVGELVYVFTALASDGYSERVYIGPIISQPHHMDFEPAIQAASLFRASYLTPEVAPSMKPETKGAFPEEEDISLEGRKDAGIQLKDYDAILKSGVKVVNPNNTREVEFNRKDPSYVLLRHNNEEQSTENGQSYGSTATIVADKINLISNDAKEGFNVTDSKDLITDEEMKKIIEKAHQLPYGDVLVEFLTLLKNAFISHTHPYSTMPPCQDFLTEKVRDYNLKKILSNDIRIN